MLFNRLSKDLKGASAATLESKDGILQGEVLGFGLISRHGLEHRFG